MSSVKSDPSKLTFSCINCGDNFRRYKSQVGEDSDPRFCSRGCLSDYSQLEVKCEFCGTEFSRYRSEVEKTDRTFCSEGCANDLRLEENKNTATCSNCGEEIHKVPSRFEYYDDHFCSEQCQREYYSGPRSPQWKEDVSEDKHLYYGSNWQDQRKSALERAEWMCEDCGINQSSHQQEHSIGLDVHHEKPLAKFTDPENANTLDNLTVLCRKCHLEHEPRNNV